MKLISLNVLAIAGIMSLTTACGSGSDGLDSMGFSSGGRESHGADDGASHHTTGDDSTDRRGGSDDDGQDDDGQDDDGQDDDGGDLMRGSQAWFAHEAVQHSVRLAAQLDLANAANLTATSVSIDGALATVELTRVDGTKLVYRCSMVDETSRRNTVVKKDVRCVAAI